MFVKLIGYILIALLFFVFITLFIGRLSLATVAGIGILFFLAYVFFGFATGGGGDDK